jgi:hypothetical protein
VYECDDRTGQDRIMPGTFFLRSSIVQILSNRKAGVKRERVRIMCKVANAGWQADNSIRGILAIKATFSSPFPFPFLAGPFWRRIE